MEHQEIRDEKVASQRYLGSAKRVKYFNTLKNDLKKELTRYIIANPSWSNNSHKAMIEDCYKRFATYRILLLSSKRTAAIEMALSLLSSLTKIEYSPLLYAVARDLVFHYSNSEPNPRLAKKYEVLMEKYQAVINAETLVHKYYNRVALICNTRDGFTADHLAFFKEAVEKTSSLLRLGSHSLNRSIYNMIISRYAAERDYENALIYCNEALGSIPKDHPNVRSLRFSFLHRKVPALLGLGRTDEAKETARQACEVVTIGGINWHIALIKRVIVCLHGGDSQEAYELYKAHQKHPCDHQHIKEYWNIIEGYLYFLIKRDLIAPYDNERFFLGKFLNDMPLYEKDKAGQNINVLIIQILVQMQREQYGSIIDRIDSLKQYIRSYTRSPETKRANIFIKMIVTMEGAQFHRTRTETKTKKLKEQLRNTPIKFGQSLAVEIIPYPMLWDEILSMLENKFRATTVRSSSIVSKKTNVDN